MNPKFSLIIPTLGDRVSLERLLGSLESVEGILDSEILLVQNPPSRRLESLPSQFPKLKIQILFSEKGVNRARNMGIRKAQGDYLVFLDDDCAIRDPLFLQKHLDAHLQNPWAFAVGGFYQNPDPSKIAQAYDQIQRDWLLKNRLNNSGECQMLLGGNFSLKRSGDTPLFDESITYGGAETEYFFRLKKNGHRFLLIPAEAEHSPHLSPGILARKATLQGQTHSRLVREGLFIEGPWISSADFHRNKYQDFYMRFFNRQFVDQNRATSKWSRIRRGLIGYHQKICFYLENRELF